VLLDAPATFADGVARHRGELFAHCYRMLGDVDRAEDALQEALTRAWQGRHTYREDISLRAWLYRIATNTCLNVMRTRRRERLEPGPCPDELLEAAASPSAGPEARYDSHESVSLAFLTVLQVLPPRQRAVLLLHDVLAFRSAEVARLLETTVQAVNSALQRARATLRGGYVRPASDHSNLLERYVRAWEAADVSGLVALLREDAVLTMPPMPAVVGARAIGSFLAEAIFPISPMRLVGTRANHAAAHAAYMGDKVFALLAVDGDGGHIRNIRAYADPAVLRRFQLGG
jgi:RNA polymerase sigma-70 factor (ECF subfamily)